MFRIKLKSKPRLTKIFVVMVVVGNLFLLTQAAPLSNLILHETKAHFTKATLEGVKWDKDAFVLDESGLLKGEGTIISSEIKTSFPFNNAVPSWNCISPLKTGIKVELRAGRDQTWTDWFEISQWGRGIPARGNGLKRSWHGYVDADILELYQDYDYIQYKITLLSLDGQESPRVRRFAIVYANKFQPGLRDDDGPSDAWGKVVDVPFFSQTVEDPSIAGRICAPTSMTMVLNYFDYALPTRTVADLAYDSFNRIYGNWPYVAAVAGELGLKSYVTRYPDWRGVEEQILKGYPVIISINFGANQLKNSPITSTAGHIIVVRGFTEDGQVVCNDPAASTKARGQVVYDRQELRRAWNNGVAIITEIEPESSNKKWLVAGVVTGIAVTLLMWLLLK